MRKPKFPMRGGRIVILYTNDPMPQNPSQSRPRLEDYELVVCHSDDAEARIKKLTEDGATDILLFDELELRVEHDIRISIKEKVS